MYINIFWIVLVCVFIGLVVKIFYFPRINKKSKNKISLSMLLGLSLLVIWVGVKYYYPEYHAKHAVAQMLRRYETMPNAILKAAVDQLMSHENDPRYCALLLFPSLTHNSIYAVAKYLAYYEFANRYCNDYWQWGQRQCALLKDMDYRGYPTELLKNIKLCEIAKSASFRNKLISEQIYVNQR